MKVLTAGAGRLPCARYVLQLCGVHVLLKARHLAVAYLPHVADLRVEFLPGLLVGSRVAPLNHDNVAYIVELSGVDGEAVPFRREPHEQVLHDSVRSQPGLAAGLVRISFGLAPPLCGTLRRLTRSARPGRRLKLRHSTESRDASDHQLRGVTAVAS